MFGNSILQVRIPLGIKFRNANIRLVQVKVIERDIVIVDFGHFSKRSS